MRSIDQLKLEQLATSTLEKYAQNLRHFQKYLGDSPIAMKTVKSIYKHFVETRGRSYLCFGENCTWCKDGYEQRLRYQADGAGRRILEN